jgi:hypothetical protein
MVCKDPCRQPQIHQYHNLHKPDETSDADETMDTEKTSDTDEISGNEETSSDPDGIPSNAGREFSENPTDRRRGSPQAELNTSSMSASSLFANLFTNSGDALILLRYPPEGDSQACVERIKVNCVPDPPIAGPSRIRQISQTPNPSLDMPEPPLFEPDTPSQISQDQHIIDRGSPSPSLPLAEDPHISEQSSPPIPLISLQVDDEESQAMEEMREQFQWLVGLLNQNQTRRWGTAYRDFADVSLLLHAVQGLGMVERRNGRISNGEFCASTGNYALTLPIFIGVMGLGHSPGTWNNKLAMYFRLRSLYSYSEHNGGISFSSQKHQVAWEIVRLWVKDQDKLLPENWITTKYGNTQLRGLVRDMIQEVHRSKCRDLFRYVQQ